MGAVDEPRAFTDGDVAAAWAAQTFAAWLTTLTPPQEGAVLAYKGPGHRDLNAQLRSDAPVGDVDLMERLDEALAVFRLSEPVVVWRGWENAAVADAVAAGFDLTGSTFTDPAYLSTSLLQDVALRYLGYARERENALLARIVLCAETQVGVYAGAPDLVFEKREFEVLLPRATPMRITGVDVPAGDSDDVPTIHFEVDP